MDVGEALEDIRELGSFKNWALERATGDRKALLFRARCLVDLDTT